MDYTPPVVFQSGSNRAVHLLWLVPSAALLGALWLGCEDTDTVEQPLDSSKGAGCSSTLPAGFPYQPGCCSYKVHVPEVTESGFDLDTLGAAPTPDHVHVSWAGPSDTTFAVNWRTDTDTKATQLLYGTSKADVEGAEAASETVKRVTGHHMLYGGLLDGLNLTRVHEVHVCELMPSTSYFYKVGAPGAWSSVYEVATATSVGATEPFSFAVLGDSRNDAAVWAQVMAVSAQGPDFQFFTGDAVAFGSNQLDWNSWFEATNGAYAVADALASTPFMVVNGNHENLALNYVAQFALPQQITEGELADGEEWYSFDYGNAHFIALNDSPPAGGSPEAQITWLDADLAAVDRSKTPWIFVGHHRSMYSCGGSHGSNIELRKQVQPLMDKYEVDIVFSGHDHLYERTRPMRGLDGEEGKVASEQGAKGEPVDQSGTIYIVSGGAGAPLYGADDKCAYTYLTESTRNYSIVDIDDHELSLVTYRLDGSKLDELKYSKK